MRSLGALLAVVVAACLACSAKNEAIVCKHKTENALDGCKATYDLCAGGQDVLDCHSEAGGFRCACIESGTKAKDFHSDDACNVTPDTILLRAGDGCGWKLD